MSDLPEVLFVCVHNAGRSQMAAALLERRAEGRVRVRSAGSAPAERSTRPWSPRWRSSASTSRASGRSGSTDESVSEADVVVTMGCGDACPVFPGKRYLDWELDDPSGKSLEDVRPIRDEIDRRVHALLAELVPSDV